MDALSKALLHLFLITTMLGIALQVSVREIGATLETPSLLARSLLANFVLVPALGVLVVKLVPMPTEVATGFLLLAVAPGGLTSLQFTQRVAGARFFSGAIVFVLALVAMFLSPVLARHVLPGETVSPLPLAPIFAFVFSYLFLPLIVGTVFHEKFPTWGESMGKVAAIVAAISIIAFAIHVFAVRSDAMRAFGSTIVFAMLFFIVGSMIIGWVMGGPEVGARRVLAIATSTRNAALCLVIALTDFPDTNVVVTVIAFSALMMLPSLIFSTFYSRHERHHEHAHARST